MKNILFLFVFGFTAAQSVTVTYNVFVDGTGFVSKKKEVLDIMASYVKICNETKVELVFSDNKASFLVLPNTTPTLDQEDVAIAISGFVTYFNIASHYIKYFFFLLTKPVPSTNTL